jgi:hypothetical protein
MHRSRLSTNRGNVYLPPIALSSEATAKNGIFPNWDCRNTGRGETGKNTAPVGGFPACFVAPPLEFQGRTQGFYPRIEAESYR